MKTESIPTVIPATSMRSSQGFLNVDHNENEVARPKLQEIFRNATSFPIVILQDIAGTGKTTAVRHWVTECLKHKETVCWLSLDADDSDPNFFLFHLADSLNISGVAVERDVFALLQSSPVTPFKVVLSSLLRSIAARNIRTTIILDDLHSAIGSEISAVLEWLVWHLPANLQLIITTRKTPPFKMAKLRSDSLIFEFPQSHLRFSEEDAWTFFNDKLGENAISQKQLTQVLVSTKGWPVALQFIALAARQSASGQVRIITDETRTGLFAFLREEILPQLPKDHFVFVLQCAILDVLQVDACNAVMERSDSETMLKWLAHLNFVDYGRDGEFRFCHPLLHEFLKDQLSELDTKTISNLHMNATAHFEQIGDFANAIEHAVKAKNFIKATAILEQEGMQLIRASRLQELKAWLEIVPDSIVHQNPRLELFWIWILFHLPFPREALSRTAKMVRNLKQDTLTEEQFRLPEGDLDAELRVLSAGVLSAAGRSAQARQVALSSLKVLRNRSGFNKGTLCNILSYSEAVLGDITAVRAASRLGFENHKRANAIFGITYSELLHAVAEIEAVDPFKAEHHIRRGLDLVRGELGQGTYPEALLSIAESEMKYDWNNLEQAQALLDTGFPIVEHNCTLLFILKGGIMRAKLAAAMGERTVALGILEDMNAGESRLFPLTMRHCILEEKVRILLQSQDILAALVALQSAGIEPEKDIEIDLERLSIGAISAHLALARFLIAQKQFSKALSILMPLEADAIERERNKSLISIRCLMSIAHWKNNSTQKSSLLLFETLNAFASKSVLRGFMDEGADLLAPLNMTRKNLVHKSSNPNTVIFCTKLIQLMEADKARVDALEASLHSSETAGTAQENDIEVLEPLTQREHEIATLLADGMTNSQISKSLSISVDTTKWHLKNLYQKLGVSNRTQAVISLTGQGTFLDLTE